jgi:hypothetical protein
LVAHGGQSTHCTTVELLNGVVLGFLLSRAADLRAWALAAILALAVAGLLAWGLGPVPVLEIREAGSGHLLRQIPVDLGDRITYSYVHSVQKTRVDEVLEVAPDHLVVRATTFDVYGAGLPSDLPDGDPSIDPVTGKFQILNMSRALPDWPVRVAFTAEQTLEVGGTELRLDSIASPTTLLVIDVGTRPRVLELLR